VVISRLVGGGEVKAEDRNDETRSNDTDDDDGDEVERPVRSMKCDDEDERSGWR